MASESFKGHWFTDHKKMVRGTLTVTETAIILELDGHLDPTGMSPYCIPLAHGRPFNGKPCTLLGLRFLHSRTEVVGSGMTSAVYIVESCIWNCTIKNANTPHFKGAKLNCWDFTRWALFDNGGPELKLLWADASAKEVAVFWKQQVRGFPEVDLIREGVRVEFLPELDAPSRKAKDRLNFDFVLRIHMEGKARNIAAWIDLSKKMRDLVRVLTGRDAQVNGLRLIPVDAQSDKDEKNVIYPGLCKAINRRGEVLDYLNSCEDIAPQMPAILENWFKLKPIFRQSAAQFVSASYSKDIPLPAALMLMVQSLEILHRETRKSAYVPKEKFKEIRNALYESIPQDLPNCLKDSIEARLMYSNEWALKDRLKDCAKRLGTEVANSRCIDDSFVDEVVDYRNLMNHGGGHGVRLAQLRKHL